MEEFLVRYIHFIGFILLASMLMVTNFMISSSLSKQELSKLLIIDRVYGASAMLTLFAGVTLWLWLGKPATFYFANPIFHIKVTLFVVAAAISFVPTRIFIQQSKQARQSFVMPRYIILIKRFELGLLLIIPLLAVLMARGIGISD